MIILWNHGGIDMDRPGCYIAWEGAVLRGGLVSTHPRLDEVVIEGVVTKRSRNIAEQDLLRLLVQLKALGLIHGCVSFIHQGIEIGVVITRAGCECCIRAPV